MSCGVVNCMHAFKKGEKKAATTSRNNLIMSTTVHIYIYILI